MFIFLLQLREALDGQPRVLLFFAVFSMLIWIMWVIKTTLSRRYRPWTEPHQATASVIVPVVDEPLDLFRDVLGRIIDQRPYEVIVVINGARNDALEQVCTEMGVTWEWTETPGKRNAVRIGVERSTGEISVLVDSDTIWTDDTLSELLKPFAEARVGGVTTKQRILEPRRSFLTRWADWMENSRALYSMPAQSVLGHVGCLPGRTIAFRRDILERVMGDFMNQRFLGVFLEVSDDRTLTNLTLKQGYRTVYQSTSLVFTDAPTDLGKLRRQQLRWARGSQYNTLRMLPWMLLHAPVLAFFFLADIVLPFLLAGSVFTWLWRSHTASGINYMQATLRAFPGVSGWGVMLGLVVVGSVLSMWLRQHRCLIDEPRDWLWMPAYILFSSFFLMPIRLYGFFRMAHAAGWGTRQNAYTVTAGDRTHRRNHLVAIPYALGLALLGGEILAVTIS